MLVNRMSMELLIFCIFRGHRWNFLNYNTFLLWMFVFIYANSADSDKIPQYAAFHLGFHCLQKYLFAGIQNIKG